MAWTALDASLAERDRFSGAALVRQGSETLLSSGYGVADSATGRSNTPETAFQIASISKQFAAAAILLLQKRGMLTVRDAVSAWVPGCPAAWTPITLHHLLTHTSGLGHWRDFPELDLCAPTTQETLLRTFSCRPLTFPPGDGWSYSSLGYVLLAHVVERASGEPYADFLRHAIFDPLGMRHTGAGNRAPHPELHATGYAGEEAVPSFELDTVSIGGKCGVQS